MRLDSRTVVFITGGASGIGLALARSLSERGCMVTVCGRDTRKLEEAEESGEGISGIVCDITRELEVLAARDLLMSTYGRTDLLINNAAIQHHFDFAEDPEAMQRLRDEIDVNFLGQAGVTKAFLPLLIASDSPTIVNVTSMHGLIPGSSSPGYSASKAAFHSFSVTLRKQLEGMGISVVEVIPPLVDTPMTRNGSYRMTPVPAEAVAARIVRSLAKGRTPRRIWGGSHPLLGGGLVSGLLWRTRRR